jgi:hypothetical protein
VTSEASMHAATGQIVGHFSRSTSRFTSRAIRMGEAVHGGSRARRGTDDGPQRVVVRRRHRDLVRTW